LLSAFLLQAYASVFVYYPISANIKPVKPPLIFQPVSTADVSSNIDPTNTSARVNVTISLTQVQLLQNPNFTGTLDPWNYSGAGSWSVSQNAGATDGWAAFYNVSVPSKRSVYSLLYQGVQVLSQQINISARFYNPNPGTDVSYNVTFGLYNSTTGTLVAGCNNETSRVTWNNWTEAHVVCTPPQAGVYLAMFNITVSNNSGNQKTAYFYLDYFSIVPTGGYGSFNGPVLQVYNQDSQSYYAVLTLDATTSTYSNITSCNITLGNSAPIQIRNGQIVTSVTSEASVAPQSAVPINVNATVTAGTSTLHLTLRYCTLPGGNGACVFYPLTITLNSG